MGQDKALVQAQNRPSDGSVPDIIERLRFLSKGSGWNPCFEAAADHLERQASIIDELYEALEGIKWRSDDKDNMEFAARVTYSQMDAIHAALAKARGESSK